MHQVETPLHWLWLVRGTEPTINVSSGGVALVMIGDFEKDFRKVGEGPLKVPLFKLSVRSGSSPSLESRITDHIQMMIKWARASKMSSLNVYGTLKSKGTQGGVSSGAGGAPLVDSIEMGLVCSSIPLTNHPGLIVLTPGRAGDLKLPSSFTEVLAELPSTEPVSRVSRYDRKWVI
jgi:hypothetical protein